MFRIMVLACMALVLCHGSKPARRSPKWDLREDMRASVRWQMKERQALSFDDTGLYEKYISQKQTGFPDDKKNKQSQGKERYSSEHLSMTKAGYMNEELVQMLTLEILESYSDIASRVRVPNNPQEMTSRTRSYHTVLKFSTQNSKNRGSSILIDGAHHSRELTSIQMVFYVMLRFLYEYEVEEYLKEHGRTDQSFLIHNLLDFHALYFIPVVNIDGFSKISEDYAKHGGLEYIRKNVRKSSPCGNLEDKGVDLNRNYDMAWGIDDDGSSPERCAEDFRGATPFSEPATRQIKNFLEKTQDGQSVKIALSLHAYGNLLVHPFNYLSTKFTCKDMAMSDEELKSLVKHSMCPVQESGRLLFFMKERGRACSQVKDKTLIDVRKAMRFYADLVDNAGLPKGFKYGNGAAMVGYSANGEASDWMFAKHGIYAMSPELGTQERYSEGFFVAEHWQLKKIVGDNYGWIRYTILKLLPSFNVGIRNIYETKRVFLNQTNLILSLNLFKQETQFQPHKLDSNSRSMGDISCHNIVIESVHPSHTMAVFQLFKGQDAMGYGNQRHSDDFKDIDLMYLEDFEKLLQLDTNIDDQFASMMARTSQHGADNQTTNNFKNEPIHQKKSDIEKFVRSINKDVIQISTLSPTKRALKVCFVNQAQGDGHPSIRLNLKIDLKRSSESEVFKLLSEDEPIISIAYERNNFLGVQSLLTGDRDGDVDQKDIGKIEQEQDKFEKNGDRKDMEFNKTVERNSVDILTIKYGDIQVVKNLQVPTNTKYSFGLLTALENKYHTKDESIPLHVDKDGMSRTTLGEIQGQLVFWLVFVSIGVFYFIVCKVLFGVQDFKEEILQCQCQCLANLKKGMSSKRESYVEEDVMEDSFDDQY